MAKYRKLIVALIGAALIAVEQNLEVLGSYGPIALSLLTAASVYFVPNAPADA